MLESSLTVRAQISPYQTLEIVSRLGEALPIVYLTFWSNEMTNTNTNTNTATATATLASRAAGLLTKATAYGVAEKAMDQALAAKRVYPAMAQDFGEQLGVELPLKTRDFTRVVGHLLQSSAKPLKGVISKRKAEILAVLAELVSVLTDTEAVKLPEWAVPKKHTTKKAEAAEGTSAGALKKANILAEAEANASRAKALNAEFRADILERAVSVILTYVSELSEAQREKLSAVLASSEAEAEA